jgi:hypothetical protein
MRRAVAGSSLILSNCTEELEGKIALTCANRSRLIVIGGFTAEIRKSTMSWRRANVSDAS